MASAASFAFGGQTGPRRIGLPFALFGLEVPLAQGYHLGRPGRPWSGLSEAAERIMNAQMHMAHLG